MALTAKKVYAILKHQISNMEAKLNSPVRYKGTVATADLLPLNPDIGDMYNIKSKSTYGEAGTNVAWNGVVWDTMGTPIDMSLYLTEEEANTIIPKLVTEYFEKNPVKPGATTEQAQQIEQNKTDIASLKTETSSLKEDLGNIDSEVFTSTDNLINPKNIIVGVRGHHYNAGQTIDNPYTKDESFICFGKIEVQKDIEYVFIYDLNKQGAINAFVDIFNEDGSYSRTAPFSFNNSITLRNSEKYIVPSFNIKQHPLLGTEMIIPKGLAFTEYIPHKVLLFEKENKELKRAISEQNFELEQVKRRLNNLNKYNELEWKSFDKAYFAFIIDDSTETLYPMYQKFHAKKVPLSSAAIVSNAKAIKVEGVGTNVDVLRLLVSDGGEVLAHYYGNLIDIGASNPDNEHEYLNTKDAWDSRVKDSKKELEQLGFNIHGIMRADYTLEKTATGEKYCMTYYDYSDGLGISKQFSLTRKNMNDLNLSEFKSWIDECISKKGFYPILTHGTEELNVNINEIIDYIISSGGVITTYRDVYDTFKSTKIEEKILSIEKRLN